MSLFREQTGSLAFVVPGGEITYIGDIVYAKDGKVDLRYDLPRARSVLRREYPNVRRDPVIARAVPVPMLPLLV